MNITIIDYGLGNHQSIFNICYKLGFKAVITDDEKTILQSDVIILPGVGSYDKGINNIKSRGLLNILEKGVVKKKIKTLGICLGAQLMLEKSDEGILNGLGYVPGRVISFKKSFNKLDITLPVPNMGWRYVEWKGKKTDPKERYYFVHSYYMNLNNDKYATMISQYGFSFVCGYKFENITGFQFHPEKSHIYGFKLLKDYFERV